MQKEQFIELYELLNEITPLLVDCGELCQGGACCRTEAGQGVYLFPGEETLFSNTDYWGKPTQIDDHTAIVCDGNCPRDERPLFCRLFPLFPYLTADGELEIIFYSPLAHICPLVKLEDFTLLAEDYLEVVEEIADKLLADSACREFLAAISRAIDRYEAEPWTNLFNFRPGD
jgi:hypothetical protein